MVKIEETIANGKLAEDIVLFLGKRLSDIRKEYHMTQATFAEKLGLSRSYYGKVERGEKAIDVETLQKVANALGMDVQDLFEIQELK